MMAVAAATRLTAERDRAVELAEERIEGVSEAIEWRSDRRCGAGDAKPLRQVDRVGLAVLARVLARHRDAYDVLRPERRDGDSSDNCRVDPNLLPFKLFYFFFYGGQKPFPFVSSIPEK